MNCRKITTSLVWFCRTPKNALLVSGVGNTSSTSENIVRSSDLVLSGKLYGYLADIDTQARTKLDMLVAQLAEKEDIDEQLKAQDQMAWVRAMNNIRNRAEEIVLNELIYGEDTV